MRTRAPSLFLTASAVALVALSGAACKSAKIKPAQDNADLSQVVAKVDDSVITVGDVQERINKQSPFIRARYTTVDKKKEFLDNLIRFEVMAKEAQKRGYDKDPEVQRVMKQQMISKFLQKDFESTLKVEDVPDAEVEKYYKEHADEYHKKEQVRVSEILVKDKAKANKVYAEAKALPKTQPPPGAEQKSFRDLVTKYSEDEESKQRGGELPFLERDSAGYPKQVIEAAFALKEIGDLSTPIQTDAGFAILKLTQKRPEFNRPLPEVKRQIQQRLFRDTRTKALDKFIADLKKKTTVEVHDDNLAKVVIDSSGGGEGAGGPGGPAGLMGGPPGMAVPGAAALGATPGPPPPGTPVARPVPQGKP